MYTQMAFVTSVRGITFLPQIAANASLSFFGAKMPLPAFFIANAFLAIMPIVFFSALVLRSSALVIVAFLVLVVATVVLATVVLATVVLVVICERGNANTH